MTEQEQIEKFGLTEAQLLHIVSQQNNGDCLKFAIKMLDYIHVDDNGQGVAVIKWALERAEEKAFLTEWAIHMQPYSFLDVQIPDWMTQAQARSVLQLYKGNPDGARSLAHFLHRVRPSYIGKNVDHVAVHPYCGMYIGIEADGHTHS